MATGIISLSSLRLNSTEYYDCGIAIARGSVKIQASTSGGRYGGYYGSALVDVSNKNFLTIIAAYANIIGNAGWWNSSCTVESNTSIRVSASGDTNSSVSVRYMIIGKWR